MYNYSVKLMIKWRKYLRLIFQKFVQKMILPKPLFSKAPLIENRTPDTPPNADIILKKKKYFFLIFEKK